MAFGRANTMPPSYNDPPSFTEGVDLPEYCRNAAADERILAARPRAPIAPLRIEGAYIFETPRLELNLGERKWPVKVPCYGWNNTVRGAVLVKDFRAVMRVVVTLEGTCSTSILDRGVVVHTSSKSLLSAFQTLWMKVNNATTPVEPRRFPFSFTIPTHALEANIPLPPSYVVTHPGLSADITYRVRVDVFVRGLRRHERLKAMIMYLPRSTPAEAPPSDPDTPQWENVPIFPKYWQKMVKCKPIYDAVEPRNHTAVVNLLVPFPRAYVSAAPVPFHISVPAGSPLVSNLASVVSVQLVKRSVIQCGGFSSVQDGIIGTAEVWKVDDESYSTPPSSPTSKLPLPVGSRRIYQGKLRSSREGGESSVNIPAFLEIQYFIRVRIRPPAPQPRDAKAYFEYFVDQPISMCTHNRIPDAEDLHEPVIGLIAVTGSQGALTTAPTRATAAMPGFQMGYHSIFASLG